MYHPYTLRISGSSCLVNPQMTQAGWKPTQVSVPPVGWKCSGLHQFPIQNIETFSNRLVTQVYLKPPSSVLITWQLSYKICKIIITMSVMPSCSVSWHSKYVHKDMISEWGACIWMYCTKKDREGRDISSFVDVADYKWFSQSFVKSL